MTFDDDRPRPPLRPVGVPTRRSPLTVMLSAVAVALLLIIIAANVYTEVVWYDHLGFAEVWRGEWITRGALFLGSTLVGAAIIWGSLAIARRARPRARTRGVLDAYREQIQPIERVASIVLPLVVGAMAGLGVASQWKQVLAWWHRTPFGIDDPEFGLDLSFYVFTLPVAHLALNFLLSIMIIATILSAFVHLLYGAITEGGRSFVASGLARTQLSIMGAAVVVLIAVKVWLGRYSLLTQASADGFDGAGYTDINAGLPARTILAGIGLLVALMFLAVLLRPDWRIPMVGVALWVLAGIVVGGVYPAIVERFQVVPNAQEFEAPYIQRNIDATLRSWGLDDIEVTPYNARTEALPDALRADAETTAQIRLLDPSIVTPAFQQLQQNKQYYDFPSQLSVDRYVIGGESRDTVIALRELNIEGLSAENRTWINDHTVFTHGFGVVAAYGNRTTSDGQPAFFEGGVPPQGDLGDYEPRIYFGRGVPDYSIVGAPEGTAPWELDYPDDASPNGQVNTTYTGDGGPAIGSLMQKLFFAIKFGEEQILFSDRVTPESQILYYRHPVERVAKVAPYLEVEPNTYPAVVDGRVVWVVDAYTATDQIPYSESISLSDGRGGRYNVSYFRNSVKATVDAFDGSVTLYAWEADDPILQTWAKAFPNSLTGIEEITPELMSHLRYPELLFMLQREQLATYHVTDAASFYSGQDFWRNPADPTATDGRAQPPYYLTLKMPGQEEPTFSLTSTFIPGGNTNRNVLTGFLAVNSETGSTAGRPDADYGQLRLLELPRDSTVPGPGQVQNAFNSNPTAQNVLNLLRQGETNVRSGNLLTLPVGGGLLYVQPVYVQSSQGTQFPLLRKVFVAFGDEVGFADTLDQALDQVFGSSPSPTDPVDPTDPTDPTDPVEPEPGQVSEARQDLQDALARAKAAIDEGKLALANGDFAAYGEAQAKLERALADAIDAEERLVEALESQQVGA